MTASDHSVADEDAADVATCGTLGRGRGARSPTVSSHSRRAKPRNCSNIAATRHMLSAQ